MNSVISSQACCRRALAYLARTLQWVLEDSFTGTNWGVLQHSTASFVKTEKIHFGLLRQEYPSHASTDARQLSRTTPKDVCSWRVFWSFTLCQPKTGEIVFDGNEADGPPRRVTHKTLTHGNAALNGVGNKGCCLHPSHQQRPDTCIMNNAVFVFRRHVNGPWARYVGYCWLPLNVSCWWRFGRGFAAASLSTKCWRFCRMFCTQKLGNMSPSKHPALCRICSQISFLISNELTSKYRLRMT